MTRQEFLALKGLVKKQERVISKKQAEVQYQVIKTRDLKEELSGAYEHIKQYRQQLAGMEAQSRQAKNNYGEDVVSACMFEECKQRYETCIDEQNEVLALGRKVLADKTEQGERAHAECRQLSIKVGEQDAKIASLNAQVAHLSTTSAGEVAEAQAQRTLSMVKGLQSDVAERDTVIARRGGQINELISLNNTQKTQIEALTKGVAERETALQFANKQATEAKAITKDQNQLIQKLMAALSGNQGV